MKTILILDDDEKLCSLYKSILTEEGFTVFSATDGASALDLVTEHPIDLAVIDIKLGDDSGLRVMRSILDVRKETKIILNSAYATFKDDFQTWSADAYVIKSSNCEELLQMVKKLIGNPDKVKMV